MNDREQCLRRLQALDFAMVDTGLFLDTHPDDEKALRYYKELAQNARLAREEYEQTYGALRQENAAVGDYWSTVATPFPWEN